MAYLKKIHNAFVRIHNQFLWKELEYFFRGLCFRISNYGNKAIPQRQTLHKKVCLYRESCTTLNYFITWTASTIYYLKWDKKTSQNLKAKTTKRGTYVGQKGRWVRKVGRQVIFDTQSICRSEIIRLDAEVAEKRIDS